MAADYYLDSDTSPPIPSLFVTGSAAKAVGWAMARLDDVLEGQIGVYRGGPCGDFLGYAIKPKGQPPYFELAEASDEEEA